MNQKPKVREDSFVGDLINALLLSPPYRGPAPESQSAHEQRKAARRKADQSRRQQQAQARKKP